MPDTTTVGYMCHMYLPVYEPRTYVSTSYMGTLGFAFPTALGAKVAVPDRPVVALVGDGGFLFAATELATAVQHDIATVTVVFDDGAYGNSNRDQRERFGGRELGTVLRNPDWVKFAESFGASATEVDGLRRNSAPPSATPSPPPAPWSSPARWTACPPRSDGPPPRPELTKRSGVSRLDLAEDRACASRGTPCTASWWSAVSKVMASRASARS